MAEGDLALVVLRHRPLQWLQGNALVIFGLSRSGSGAQQFRLFKTDRNWRSAVGGDLRDVPYWTMYATQACQGGVAQGIYASGSAPFDVHYVSMREFKNGQWEDANTTHYVLPGNAGADMMVTSKLNGCTFGIGSDANGTRLVSHLRPANTSPNPLADQVEVARGTEAGFASHGGSLDYRVNSTGADQGTVIGLRSNGSWAFYIQRYRFNVSGQQASGLIDAVTRLS